MALYFPILLGVVAGVAIAVAAAIWLLKRRRLRSMREHTAAIQLLDERWTRPGRIRLKRTEELAPGAPFEALWEALGRCGFQKLADFEDRLEPMNLRAAVHESTPIAAVLVEYAPTNAYFTLFAVTTDKRMLAVSTDPGGSFRSRQLTWLVYERLSVEAAWKRFGAIVQREDLREMDVRLFRSAWERSYAARMDLVLRESPSRERLEQELAGRDPAPTPAEVDAAYEMLVEHWHDELETALLDHYRRSSGIDAATWERVANDLHVVHDLMHTHRIDQLMPGGDVVEHIFDQCVAHGYHGIQLYEKVMGRLPGAQRRTKLGEVSRPVKAVVYGPAGMEADREGFEPPTRPATAASG